MERFTKYRDPQTGVNPFIQRGTITNKYGSIVVALKVAAVGLLYILSTILSIMPRILRLRKYHHLVNKYIFYIPLLFLMGGSIPDKSKIRDLYKTCETQYIFDSLNGWVNILVAYILLDVQPHCIFGCADGGYIAYKTFVRSIVSTVRDRPLYPSITDSDSYALPEGGIFFKSIEVAILYHMKFHPSTPLIIFGATQPTVPHCLLPWAPSMNLTRKRINTFNTVMVGESEASNSDDTDDTRFTANVKYKYGNDGTQGMFVSIFCAGDSGIEAHVANTTLGCFKHMMFLMKLPKWEFKIAATRFKNRVLTVSDSRYLPNSRPYGSSLQKDIHQQQIALYNDACRKKGLKIVVADVSLDSFYKFKSEIKLM